MKRRNLLAMGLASAVPMAWSAAPHDGLPAARDLQAELAAAIKAVQPLVVMVSLEGCPWCKLARESYLRPMHDKGEVHVVQVDMRSPQPVRDFDGAMRTHDELIRSWKVRAAPTLIFFGAQGRELAPRLVGASPDFFGGYLDERLEASKRAVVSMPSRS